MVDLKNPYGFVYICCCCSLCSLYLSPASFKLKALTHSITVEPCQCGIDMWLNTQHKGSSDMGSPDKGSSDMWRTDAEGKLVATQQHVVRSSSHLWADFFFSTTADPILNLNQNSARLESFRCCLDAGFGHDSARMLEIRELPTCSQLEVEQPPPCQFGKQELQRLHELKQNTNTANTRTKNSDAFKFHLSSAVDIIDIRRGNWNQSRKLPWTHVDKCTTHCIKIS